MESLVLLSDQTALDLELRQALGWAEQFSFCASFADSVGGRWRLWHDLEQSLHKLERAYVGLEGLRTEPLALDLLHRTGRLRLVPAADGSFQANLWSFGRGGDVQVFLGGTGLGPSGLALPLRAVGHWRGHREAPFALQVSRLLQELSLRAYLPTEEDLSDYAAINWEGQEFSDALTALGAQYISPAVQDADVQELVLVTDETEIAQAQESLETAFGAAADCLSDQAVGHRGGSAPGDVYWVRSLGVWAVFEQLTNRYWNAFGVEVPGPGRSLGITVEINPPLEGVNRRMAGAFAREVTTGHLYFVHRGRIGGGAEGVGKELFWQRFRGGVPLTEGDGKPPARVAVVGRLDSPSLVRDVAAFVHQVHRMKQSVRGA